MANLQNRLWDRVKQGGDWLRQRLLRDQSITLLRLEGDALRQRVEAAGESRS